MSKLKNRLYAIEPKHRDSDFVIIDLVKVLSVDFYGERNNSCTNNNCGKSSENLSCTNNTCDIPSIPWTMNIDCHNNRCQ